MGFKKCLCTTNYLITREEAVAATKIKARILSKELAQKKQIMISILFIILYVACLFQPGNLEYMVICLAMAILVLGFVMFYNFYIKTKTPDKNLEKTQTVSIYEDSIAIKNDKYSAGIPFDMLDKIYDSKDFFAVCINPNNIKFIPKRALVGEDCEKFSATIKSLTSEKFLKL